MLSDIREKIRLYQPALTGNSESSALGAAAVLMLLTRESSPELIFTLRHQDLSTHGGEVAFPGGKRDLADRDLQSTALRETQEEIGLHPGVAEILGRLDRRTSRFGLEVAPFVASIEADVALTPDRKEVSEIFRVPLAHFMDLEQNLYTKPKRYEQGMFHVPHFACNGYTIIGLTAVFVINLVDVVLGTRTDPFEERGLR